MPELKAGDAFPEGVSFTYVPYTPEQDDIIACGMGIKYDASKGKPPSPLPGTGPHKPSTVLTKQEHRGQGEEDRHRRRARRLHPDVPGAARRVVHQKQGQAQGQGRRPGGVHRLQ